MPWVESAWVEQIFAAASAQNGGIVRRKKADVAKYASLEQVIQAAKTRGFHVVETGGQVVVLCHQGALTIHV